MTTKEQLEQHLVDAAKKGVKDWIAESPREILCPTPSLTDQRFRQVARVQVGKESARSWRVTLGPLTFRASAVNPVLGSAPIIAEVQWGFDGALFAAEIDWPAQGGHFNVWGDNVNVSLRIPSDFQTDPVLPAADPLTAVIGTAIIAPTATAGGPRPTRTLYTGTLAPLAFSAPLPVPAMAIAVRWHQFINLSATNAPIPLFFAGTQDAALLYPTQTTPTDIVAASIADVTGGYTTSERTWPSPDGITLHPLTRFLSVQNAGAVVGDDISLQIEFVLDLE